MPPRSATSKPTPAPRRKNGGGGGFWLLIAILVGVVAGVYVAAPDLPRRLFGSTSTPTQEGPPPTTAGTVQAELEAKQQEVTAQASKVTVTDKPTVVAKAATKAAAPAKPADKGSPGEAQAQTLIAQALVPYRAMKWQEAMPIAQRAAALESKPETKLRARAMVEGCRAIPQLFAQLDDDDELARNFDTHPSLVIIHQVKEDIFAIPIRSMDDRSPIERDPLGYIETQRKMGTAVFLLKARNKFLPTPLDEFGKVSKADVPAMIAQRRDEFTSRLNRLKNSQQSREPLAWYEAGKVAWQNRLDDLVVDQLDRAVTLDPQLIRSVREDRAAYLFGQMVIQLKNDRKNQGAIYMTQIDKKYKDTDKGKEARLYYDGKSAELLALAKEANDRRRQAEEERRSALIARAKDAGDEAQAKAIADQVVDEEEPEVQVSATGDEGGADQLSKEGAQLMAKGQEMGNTDGRDEQYAKALIKLREAVALYSKLVEKSPNDANLGAKLHAANQMKYQAIKMQRFH